ncbi:hypothetical protein V8E36_008046 [Tilletia maclaganii]
MNSENAQAMSAQDWLLDDDQLQVAARISLTNASSTTDVKKRRQDAILAARHFDAKLPSHSALLQAEMDALRTLERSLSEAKTIADAPSSHRAASLPDEDVQPAMERQRQRPAQMAPHGSVPADKDSGKHHTADMSAAERFFEVSELVALVFKHLVYDRIDLVSLSRVSKRCRSIALPLLVECLNIPFTKADKFSVFFKSNPGLRSHVKFLRLWDDVAEATSRRKRSDPAHELSIADWDKLGKLLALFDFLDVQVQPVLALSVGQVQLFKLRTPFQMSPWLLGRLVSLEILDDVFPSTTRIDDAELYDAELAAFSTLNAGLAESLTLLLHEYFHHQCEPGVALRKFALAVPDRSRIDVNLPEFGLHLAEWLEDNLTHLKLENVFVSGDSGILGDLVYRRWLALESIDLQFKDSEYLVEFLEDVIGDLIKINPSIHKVRVFVCDDGGGEGVGWCNMASPDQITELDVEDWNDTPLATSEFARRHKAIRDLTLHHCDDASALIA